MARPALLLRALRAAALAVPCFAAPALAQAPGAPVALPDSVVVEEEMGGAFGRLFVLTPRVPLDELHVAPEPLVERGARRGWIEAEGVRLAPARRTGLRAGKEYAFRLELPYVPGTGTYTGRFEVVAVRGGDTSYHALPVRVTVRPAASPLGASPRAVELVGVVGAGSSTREVTVEAGRDVQGVSLVPGTLRRSGGADSVPAAQVEVSPEGVSLRAGERQVFRVTVHGVPAPGRYRGALELRHAGQGEGGRSELRLSLEAARLVPVPSRTVVEFVAGRWGAEAGEVAVGLDAGGERVPAGLLPGAGDPLRFELSPLVRAGDEPEAVVLRGVHAVPDPEGGAHYLLRVPNPRVRPGSYTGTMTLSSAEVGTLAAVPVEVRVRGSAVLAWLLLVLGLVVSMWVTHWNTVGRRKNALRGELGEVERRLERVEVTAGARAEAWAMLDPVRRFLEKGKPEEAESALREAAARIDRAILEKAELKRKAAEVRELHTELVRVAEQLRGEVSPRADLRRYLERVEGRVAALLAAIEGEEYDDAAGAQLRDRVGAERAAVEGLALLFRELEAMGDDVERVDRAYRAARAAAVGIEARLRERFVEGARAEVGRIDREKDFQEVSRWITAEREVLRRGPEVVEKLEEYRREIDRKARKLNRAMARSRKAVEEGWKELEAGRIPDPARLDAIRELMAAEESGEPAPVQGAAGPRLFAAAAPLPAPVAEGQGGAAAGAAPPREAVPRTAVGRRVRGWWTPKTEATLMEWLLYGVALAVLTVVGYTQTYGKDPTFGATDPLMEYASLFLWGFGIQTATATVAGVLGTLRGTRTGPGAGGPTP